MNKVTLSGQIWSEAIVRHTPKGKLIVSVELQTACDAIEPTSRERMRTAEIHQLVFMGALATQFERSLFRGRTLSLVGKLGYYEGRGQILVTKVDGAEKTVIPRFKMTPMSSFSGPGIATTVEHPG